MGGRPQWLYNRMIKFSIRFFGLLAFVTAALVVAGVVLAAPQMVRCGDGYESDNYGFSYDLEQYHWTVGWENYVSEQTVDEVDVVLDDLNADFITQTMILFQPAEAVGNRVNCAVHFLRYMQLGQPDGERQDNGFVFLIVVEEESIDVHYSVGIGLPALTAQGLSPINRLAEDVYQQTGSMDEALLALVNGYNEYSRSNYAPYTPPAGDIEPSGFTLLDAGMICCCVSMMLVFLVVMIMLSRRQMRRPGLGGSRPRPLTGARPRPTSSWSSSSRPPRPSSSSARPRRPTRGGSGGGRSGRGN